MGFRTGVRFSSDPPMKKAPLVGAFFIGGSKGRDEIQWKVQVK